MVLLGLLWDVLAHIRYALFGQIQVPVHPVPVDLPLQGQDMMITILIILVEQELLQCLEAEQQAALLDTEKKDIKKLDILLGH